MSHQTGLARHITSKRAVWGLYLCTWLWVVLFDLQQLTQAVTWGIMAGVSLIFAGAVYWDSNVMGRVHGWPHLHGAHYLLLSIIPGFNCFLAVPYLVNRAEVVRFGSPLLSLDRFRAVEANPRGLLASLYAGAGIVLSVILLVSIFVVTPLSAIFRPEGIETDIIGILLWLIFIGILWYRRYTAPSRQAAIDRALRDLSVRFLAVPGLFVFVTLLFPVILVVSLLVSIGLIPFFEGGFLGIILASLLFALWLIPITALLLLPFRLWPWLTASPHVLSEWLDDLRAGVGDRLPDSAGDGPEREWSLLPTTGHDHSRVDIDVTVDLSLPDYYGYTPRSVAALRTDSTPSSAWTGAFLAFPGLLYATVVFTALQLQPQQTAAAASRLPAEDIVLLFLGWVGIPRPLAVAALGAVGLPPETLSLGLVGGVVPLALLIPSAWHVAIEYENLLYRFLQRLGDRNHLLLLWLVHAVPVVPLVLGYWRLHDWLATDPPAHPNSDGQSPESSPPSSSHSSR